MGALALPVYVPGTGKVLVGRPSQLSCTRLPPRGGGGSLLCTCRVRGDRAPRRLEDGRYSGLAQFVERRPRGG